MPRSRLLLVPVFLLASIRAVSAATFTVNSTLDAIDAAPGDGICATAGPTPVCTLRAAVQEANALAGSDTIVLPAGVFTLTLAGPGQDDSATGDLDLNDFLSNGSVTISGAGAASTIIDGGTVDRAVEINGIAVTMLNLTIRNANSSDLGGAILNGAGSTLTLQDVVLSGNNAAGGGGGIENYATATLLSVSLVNNTAPCGAGIDNLGTLTITNSTFSGNAAGCDGGGILNYGDDPVSINNSTFAFNTPNNLSLDGAATVTITNSILSVSGGVNCSSTGAGVIADAGGNVAGGAACETIPVTSGAELLGPLTTAANGQQVRLPLVGNPAIGGGVNASCASTDQRGTSRPQGTRCDSGAVEVLVSPVISSGTPPAGVVGSAYSHTFTSTGEPPITYSLLAGTLPAGLSLSAAGVVSGAPGAAGTSTFTVRATDADRQAADQATSITVSGSGVTIIGTPPAASVNVAYTFTFNGTGNGALTYAVITGVLPAGLSLSSGGVVSGTPTAAGTFAFTVRVTDSTLQTANLAASITVTGPGSSPGPSISGTPPAARWSVPYTFTFTGTGTGALTYAITSGALPAGLSLSTSGVVSGTPTVIGASSFTVRLTDSTSQTASLGTTITVSGTGVAVAGTPPNAAVSIAYTFAFSGTGNGALTYTLTAGALPAGLALSPSGVVSGTPTTSGTFSFTVTGTDTTQQTGRLATSLKVTSSSVSIIGTPPSVTAGVPYTFALTGTGNGALIFALAGGSLPSGMVLSPGGVISGTATTTGCYPVIVRVIDASGQTTTREVRVGVNFGCDRAPLINGLRDITVEENRAVASVVLEIVDDLVGPDPLTATVSASDPALFTELSITGGGATRTLRIDPAEDRHGSTVITVTVRDGMLSTTKTAVLTVTPAPIPNAPTDLTATADGDFATFSWHAPVTGAIPTYFVFEGGNDSGLVRFPVVNTGHARSFRTVVPAGRWFFRVRSGNGSGLSSPSAEITGVVGPGARRPGAPQGLVTSVSGNRVQVGWQPPVDGGPLTSWQLELGSAPGSSDRGVFPIRESALAVEGALPPDGRYFVRLRGVNDAGAGPASNEATFVSGAVAACTSVPDAPVLLPAAVANRLVTLIWRPPANSPVTAYRLMAGTATGRADLATFDLGAVTSFAATAPSGRYFVSIAARNACGTSPPSTSVVVDVP